MKIENLMEILNVIKEHADVNDEINIELKTESDVSKILYMNITVRNYYDTVREQVDLIVPAAEVDPKVEIEQTVSTVEDSNTTTADEVEDAGSLVETPVSKEGDSVTAEDFADIMESAEASTLNVSANESNVTPPPATDLSSAVETPNS